MSYFDSDEYLDDEPVEVEAPAAAGSHAFDDHYVDAINAAETPEEIIRLHAEAKAAQAPPPPRFRAPDPDEVERLDEQWQARLNAAETTQEILDIVEERNRVLTGQTSLERNLDHGRYLTGSYREAVDNTGRSTVVPW